MSKQKEENDMKTDIQIAQECVMSPITEIAEKAGIDEKYLEQYGKYKAKIDYNLLNESDKQNGKLITVTVSIQLRQEKAKQQQQSDLQMDFRNLEKMLWLHFVSHHLDLYLE